MINHLSLLALSNASDPSELVVLSNIMDGVAGAATMYYDTERSGDLQIEAKDTILTKVQHNIEAQVLWSDASTTLLNAWRTNQTPLRIAGYGIDGAMIWAVTARVSPTQQFDNVHSMGVRITLDSLPAYVNGRKSVQVGENILGIWDVTSGDANVWNGFSVTSGSSTRSGASLTLNGDIGLTNLIFFPFAGRDVTFGFETTGGTGQATFELTALDNGSNVIATYTTTSTSGVTLPAGTFEITVDITTTGGDVPIIRNPFIRLIGTRFTLE
jgi:hypothetical protein